MCHVRRRVSGYAVFMRCGGIHTVVHSCLDVTTGRAYVLPEPTRTTPLPTRQERTGSGQRRGKTPVIGLLINIRVSEHGAKARWPCLRSPQDYIGEQQRSRVSCGVPVTSRNGPGVGLRAISTCMSICVYAPGYAEAAMPTVRDMWNSCRLCSFTVARTKAQRRAPGGVVGAPKPVVLDVLGHTHLRYGYIGS